MANDNDTAEAASATAAQNAEQEIDKFQGFSTKDGEVEKPVAAAGARVPNTGKFTAKAAAPAKKAEVAEGDDDATAGDDKHASADKRIGQAVGRQRAAERRADAAEARATATEARLANLEARLTQGGNQPTAPKAPDPKDYDGGEYDARYLADVAKHEARVAVAAERASLRTENQATAAAAKAQERTAEFQAKRDEFFSTASETYDDFEEVVGANDNPLSPTLGDLALDSEHGAQILYELAGDPKEAFKLAKMTPAKQAAWFGRQEARLSLDDTSAGDDGGDGEEKPQSGPKPKVSKAPPAPGYTPRGSGEVPKVSGSTTDFAAFERAAAASQK